MCGCLAPVVNSIGVFYYISGMDTIITVKRIEKSERSTISTFTIDNRFKCYCIEDKDRGLKQSDSLLWVKAKKIFGVTAIPTGRYQVALTFSNRFKKVMPEILNVTGFSGVRIHTGNTAEDSEGCLIVGLTKDKDFVGASRMAFEQLMDVLTAADRQGRIYIDIS